MTKHTRPEPTDEQRAQARELKLWAAAWKLAQGGELAKEIKEWLKDKPQHVRTELNRRKSEILNNARGSDAHS